MLQLKFYDANIYAPAICVLEENANLEHIQSTFPICPEFRALPWFLEQLKTLQVAAIHCIGYIHFQDEVFLKAWQTDIQTAMLGL